MSSSAGFEPRPGTTRPRLTVVSGPSGVGKSSVVSALRALHPDLYFSVSVTTRPPRPGEVDGQHYRFIDKAEFDRLAGAGELLEHAEYAGNHYGTPRAAVEAALDAGRPAVLEIELQGARQVRAAMPGAQLVMLVPPSWETLVTRLVGRGTEDEALIAKRLAVAKEELAAESEFDKVLVNSDVQVAASELLTWVLADSFEQGRS
ncbi:guanylate kinase [Actinokineospora sp. G85]|uniref:guanylate kinase n=1 Tax=Actinokineospora sp. G85 TaxID=3406626 RepID=UPI003C7475D4